MTPYEQFREQFQADAAAVAVAPGRVNLIGEHTDYNDGFVLPMNVERYTQIAFRPRSDGVVRVYSAHARERAEFALGAVPATLPSWTRYVAQVAAVLQEAALPIGGFDGYITSDLPVGGGLSSSAALESSTAAALLASGGGAAKGQDLSGLLKAAGKTRVDLALLCQEAEHRVGTMCGIMDQFVVLNGAAGCALLIDCRSLKSKPVPITGRLDLAVVVVNTRVHHDLATGAYNERRRQCEEAVRFFAGHLKGVKALRDVTPWQWEKWADKMDPVIARRARHVITENERAQVTLVALERDDPVMAGRCLNASHDSLRDDYEVSCRELDLLVEIAQGVSGVYGSRMTGGGFGGCTVTLCQSASVEPLRAAVTEKYQAATGLEAEVLVTQAADWVELQWR